MWKREPLAKIEASREPSLVPCLLWSGSARAAELKADDRGDDKVSAEAVHGCGSLPGNVRTKWV